MQTITQPKRLASIDALRGFDMLLIAGGGTFIYLLHGKTQLAWVDAIANQLEHPEWNGFTFYDFIFPLFLFLAGTSLSYSLNSGLAKGASKASLYKKMLKRMLILIGLGMLYKNFPLHIFEPSQIRFGSVLGRIGFAGLITTLVYLNFPRKILYWVAAILLGYYALLFWVPVPGFGAGDLSFEGNLVGWVDRHFMPGKLKQETYDELALLTQLPALCLTMLGTIAGDTLRSSVTESSKLRKLGLYGIVALALGLVWSLHFPINKHLWTSSFILLTAGMAFLFLAFFYWIIDVKGYTKWAFFFKVIGMNSLVIYLAYQFIDFNYSSERIFKSLYMYTPEKWQEVFQAFGATILVWLFLYFLYRKKIFIKI